MLESPPKNIEQKILRHVMRDLNPSFAMINLKLAISTVVGGILSLFVCGQFGIGFTNFAEIFSSQAHEQMGPIFCAVVCGGLYALFPVTILRLLLCNALQFRVITTRKFALVLPWYLGFGWLLSSIGHDNHGVSSLAGWIAASVAVTVITSKTMQYLAPKWQPVLQRIGLLD